MLSRVERERIAMMLMAGGLLLALLVGHATAPPEPPPPPAPMAADDAPRRGVMAGALPGQHQHRCAREVEIAMAEGIVIAFPIPGRMDVDDRLWTGLAPYRRGALMRAAACAVWPSGRPPPGEELAAYGAASGRRLAVLSGLAGKPR